MGRCEDVPSDYDLSEGVRGKYVNRIKGSAPVVLLESDIAEVFTDSESVNRTLRGLLPLIDAQVEKVQQR